jgi:Protein of unknown function (DUF1579)
MKLVHGVVGVAMVGWFLLPLAAVAQEKKEKQPEMPFDAPGDVHKQMSVLAGIWDVEVTYIFGGKENKGNAKCEAHWILDGRFLQQDYKSSLMGTPFTVLQYLGYDNRKKKTIELMMDTMNTGVLHNEGSISKDGKVITNEGDYLDPAGKVGKLRTVTTVIDQDHYTLEWFQVEADGKATRMVSMKHTRKKA